jgi:hypothetical protein
VRRKSPITNRNLRSGPNWGTLCATDAIFRKAPLMRSSSLASAAIVTAVIGGGIAVAAIVFGPLLFGAGWLMAWLVLGPENGPPHDGDGYAGDLDPRRKWRMP